MKEKLPKKTSKDAFIVPYPTENMKKPRLNSEETRKITELLCGMTEEDKAQMRNILALEDKAEIIRKMDALLEKCGMDKELRTKFVLESDWFNLSVKNIVEAAARAAEKLSGNQENKTIKNKPMEDEQPELPAQVGAWVHLPQTDDAVPAEKIWVEGRVWGNFFRELDEILHARQLEKVKVEVYTRWEKREKDWNFRYEKEYVHILYRPEYMLLKDSDYTLRASGLNDGQMIIHLPTGTIIQFFQREWVNFADDMKEDLHNVFYNFRYIADNENITPMVAFANIGRELNSEEHRHYKDVILKEGAKWFCQHLQNGIGGFGLGDNLKKRF